MLEGKIDHAKYVFTESYDQNGKTFRILIIIISDDWLPAAGWIVGAAGPHHVWLGLK